MVDGDEITALLDRETARIGDPAEEFGHLASSTGGALDMTQFLHYYREAGGRQFSEYRLRHSDVYDCTQRALACQVLLGRIDKSASPNINWIVYGLRYGYHYAQNVELLDPGSGSLPRSLRAAPRSTKRTTKLKHHELGGLNG